MYVSIWNWIQKYKPKKICRFLRLPHHHVHIPLMRERKHYRERIMQYIKKDRTECFDDYYFPCQKEEL